MQLEINDHRKIFALQEEFNTEFPFLRIEFFNKPHKQGAPSSKRSMLPPARTIGECRIIHNKGMLTIQPQMTVAELEENFSEVYGLAVQVFRKSGKNWLETSTTDGWTLAKQNDTGKEMEQ